MSNRTYVLTDSMLEFADILREGTGKSQLLSFPDDFESLYNEYQKNQTFKLSVTLDDFIEGTASVVSINVSQLGCSAFYADKTIESVNIPFCKKIDSWCFAYCSNLASINAPECSFISEYAFNECGLETLNLPRCKEIYKCAFLECSNLSFANLTSCTSIGSMAFAETGLTTIDLPNIVSLGTSVFAGCSNLTHANFGPEYYYVPDLCFINCINLHSFQFDNISYIFAYAFCSCGFSSLYIPSEVTIEEGAFKNCSNLKTINISSCYRHISGQAFYQCTNLESACIKGSFYLGSQCFAECSTLKEIDINCYFTDESCFENCSSLSVVYFNYNYAPYIAKNTFKNCVSLMSVYITGSYSSKIRIPNNVYSFQTNIMSNAFYNTPITTSSLTGAYGSIYIKSEYYNRLLSVSTFASLIQRIVSY